MDHSKTKKSPPVNYAKLKKQLSSVHQFSFKTRKHFTPAQKAAITRQWHKHASDLKEIKKGTFTFIKATKTQKKWLGDVNHINTNKGMILKQRTRKVRIIGHGKNTKLKFERGVMRGKELYIPMDYYKDPVQQAIEIIKKYKPEDVMIGIRGHMTRMGGGVRDKDDKINTILIERYISRLIDVKVPKKIWERKDGTGHFISGLYLFWSSFRKR